MSDELDSVAIESTQDALMETYGLLLKASNRTSDLEEIKTLKKERRKVGRELDRIELAQINSLVLPETIKAAILDLQELTKMAKDEKERLADITQKLKTLDSYLDQAKKVLGIAGKLLIKV